MSGEVSGRAREAAYGFFRRGDVPLSVKMVLGHDPEPLVQAFATFEAEIRASTTPPADADVGALVAKVREHLVCLLKCTPANTNFYDCGDPFQIALDALRLIDVGLGGGTQS